MIKSYPGISTVKVNAYFTPTMKQAVRSMVTFQSLEEEMMRKLKTEERNMKIDCLLRSEEAGTV